MKAWQIHGCCLLNSSEHLGEVLMIGITLLVVGFVQERKRGRELLDERNADERCFKTPNCVKGVFIKHLFSLLLPVKSIRFT